MTVGALLPGLVAAGLLLGATFLHPALAWIATAPLLVGERRGVGRSLAQAVTLAVSYALAAHAPWLTEAGERYFLLSPAAAAFGAIVLALGCGVSFGLPLGVLLHAVRSLDGRWSPLALAAAWVSWEELTRIGFPSYPWVALAATQADVGVVLQTASLAGQAGLAFALAAVGGAVGESAARRLAGRPAGGPLALALALVAAVVVGGAVRLHDASRNAAQDDATDRSPLCTLAAVDAGVSSPTEASAASVARHRSASTAALALAPDAVVWPESALPRDPRLDAAILDELRALARAQDTVLLAGAPRIAWDAAWQPLLYNTLFAILPDGTVRSYDKRALVPIGEYWPFAWPAAPASLLVAEVEPGVAPLLVEVGRCRVGALICSDAERPALARELALHGADALVVASNDAALPARAVAAEVAQARLRAVETGLPVLRAANAGASVALDRYGRATPRRDGEVVLAVDTGARLAPAIRWAEPFRALCALATVITLAAGFGPWSRR